MSVNVHPGGKYGGRKAPKAAPKHLPWEQLVQRDRDKREPFPQPEEIPFTYPEHANAPQAGTRRERRAAGVDVALVTENMPRDVLLDRRARRRADERYRARRQRKGNRIFQRQQRARAQEIEVIQVQQRVLHGPPSPMRDNVAHALRHKYADDLAEVTS